ncbi:hypothetical protein KXX44_003472 [Aspergillus fumigatus]|nr:hypothetical protein KXX44_003472 [Aspergillus fumigatus]KAH1843021.1 hypothetical protein KXX55_003519 [Aspergillus fumigatus]KAH2443914.1 hypothetical protein KXV83_002533 [Aspergillus fumigatus]KAH2980265.1 hypothetical protein KXW58_002893 [Aspergillus fumigatus]KAH3037555.1 hypothetical protein KXW01_004240 [Aspergillus fumigatus]
MIYELQVSQSQKLKLALLLAVVCSTFIASAIRLRVTVPLLGSHDLTYAIAPVALLVGVESNLIVIAACVPAIGQIIRLFRGEPRPFRAVDSPAHPLRSNRQRPVVLSDGSNGRALAWPVTIESVRGHNSTGKFESAQPGLHLQQGFPLKRNRRHQQALRRHPTPNSRYRGTLHGAMAHLTM